MENKTGKYFKYAIGEIILVVIGILIALQINNWNEKRKLKSEEHLLLFNLSESFERKLAELENKNIGRGESIESILQLLEIISSKDKTLTEEKMNKFRGDLFMWYAVNEEFSVIEMLYSSGKINTVSNDLLKSKLIEWPDKMEEMLEEQRVLQSLVVGELNPLLRKYISTLNFRNHLIRDDNSADKTIQSPFPIDFEGLLNDILFESLITENLFT
ncbi:DUF6090 family protein [Winogradskyella ouciana]|uniref:Uncharacterized protein n=1 Tax=Winogradskyella ouciana TaxID=2608631 RepID=A0A7K1GBN6_9FLAO|nr:DUF6090 family protein [Winogradskyella ouciana]MTE25788.1 hypothetical protein [Winogradskyella ouciana]